jgi:hypothetical protein
MTVHAISAAPTPRENHLLAALHAAGFSKVFSRTGMMEIDALAFKGAPDQATCALLGI